MNGKLPVDALIPDICASLETHHALLFRSTPGSGKTTRIPPALLKAKYHLNSGRKKILVLEPRRVAAKFSATRVAAEMNEQVGQTVGYRFRFESRTSPQSQLIFITEGILLRMLENDPQLRDVSTVVLDEFHERHLTTDLAIALLRKLQTSSRPDLRIVILSATIEKEPILEYLKPCAFLELISQTHPIETVYLDSKNGARIDDEVFKAVRLALQNEKYQGDILVFLPGMKEIRFCETRLLQAYGADRKIEILPLHGDIDRKEQDRAILPIPGVRKIILSTNIAESSLTIENLSVVIDSGLERQALTNPWTGLTHLHTKSISKASATQRAGRAGRMQAGLNIRLYSKADFDARVAQTKPEIKRVELSETLLDLIFLGVNDFDAFPFFERPEPGTFKAALELLYRLDATSTSTMQTSITETGRKMAEFSIHPRIARALLEARTDDEKSAAVLICALLNEEELSLMSHLQAKQGRMSFAAKKLSERIASTLGEFKFDPKSDIAQNRLAAIFIHGFPDRVARIRAGSKNELALSHGGMVKIDGKNSFLDPKYSFYLVLAQFNGAAEYMLPLDEETLFDITHDGIAEVESGYYDKSRDSVRVTKQIRYGSLVLSEEDFRGAVSAASAEVLLKEAIAVPASDILKLPIADSVHRISQKLGREDIEPWFARLKLLGFEDAILQKHLIGLFAGIKSLKEAKTFEVDAKFAQLLSSEDLARVNRECPAVIQLPRRKNTPIRYLLSQEPVLESRLQDFFGLKQTPTILGGKHRLKLSLLAPNYRPVQVTNDIAGFFERTYPEVRKSLMRQYPKHSWPEKP